jgi:hypothetical protein
MREDCEQLLDLQMLPVLPWNMRRHMFEQKWDRLVNVATAGPLPQLI